MAARVAQPQYGWLLLALHEHIVSRVSVSATNDEMLIYQHVYGMYGYMAPVLHLHRMDGGDFFDMYIRSFGRVWETSPPIQESAFWRQRTSALSVKPAQAAR